MADYIITPATSVFTDTGPAFVGGTGSADSVTVEAGAALITTGNLVSGAVLEDGGPWTVTVHGAIYGTFYGLELQPNAGQPATITISGDGTIGAVQQGLRTSLPSEITNHGEIYGQNQFGVVSQYELTLWNGGSISGGTHGVNGLSNLTVTNTGTIGANTGAGIVTYGGTEHTIKNSGTVEAHVDINSGAASITNWGTIEGDVTTVDETDTVVNAIVRNKKKVAAGSIEGNVELGDGNDALTNVAKVKFTKADGKKKVKVTGGEIDGDVNLGGGDDIFKNFAKVSFRKNDGEKKTKFANGEVDGTIDLGDGDDTFSGGNKAETVMDGDGADTVKLRGGDDIYVAMGASAGDGEDTIAAGSGTDLYDASNTDEFQFIDLDAGTVTLLAQTAGETISGFENVAGGSDTDVITGDSQNNVLQGNGGGDIIFGLGGDDDLQGGDGTDTLTGGSGSDILTGGADTDAFVFESITDSGQSAATRDIIVDFETDGLAGERIDLSAIDADTSTGADDAFVFIGTNVIFSGTAGELRAYFSANGQIVEGDVDGDSAADFSFEILDPTHVLVLSAVDVEDFIL